MSFAIGNIGITATRSTTTMRRTIAGNKTKSGRAASVIPDQIYPETGASTYSNDYENALWPNWTDGKSDEDIAKLAESELIHGRWAMMGCAGSWAGEVGTGTPWFKAGALCTPDDCSAVNTIFPGQVWALGPTIGDKVYPNFYNVLFSEIVLIGLAEAYRGGLIDPAFPQLTVGDLHPGGPNFDPLGLSDSQFGRGFETMRIAELKHARLAMFSFLGYIVQAFVTSPNGFTLEKSNLPSYTEGAPGPYANWLAHVADPVGDNLFKYL
eukprot:CAMPEP_0182913504 /NCGR_PEP_ID=MMETSP0034_2-20130328/38077_1 /TAXON_ID=156128 /ORGANISM="Nephroselmis pyriformis, Strain CCMP717" /LENGTH=266 /DNA_ID=CAMNT_0025050231 /DNA_START=28 /DNA_END=828 /DNA_ORIENTATION=-